MDRKELIEYYAPVVKWCSLSSIMIGNHMTLYELANLKCAYAVLENEIRNAKKRRIKKELEKPFIIAYWNCFKRVV